MALENGGAVFGRRDSIDNMDDNEFQHKLHLSKITDRLKSPLLD